MSIYICGDVIIWVHINIYTYMHVYNLCVATEEFFSKQLQQIY